jgi:hypothetical protein
MHFLSSTIHKNQMKETEKDVSMSRYAMYLGLVLLTVCSLVFVLSSCDKDEIVDNERPAGAGFRVSVTVSGIAPESAEDIARSTADDAPIIETIPVGDGMVMEMRLEADPAAELRAGTDSLGVGKKFVLVATNTATNKYAGHAEYTIGDSGPELSGAGPVFIFPGTNYRFLCVSLNSDASPLAYAGSTLAAGQEPKFTNIPGDVDLLSWTATLDDPQGDQVVDVVFSHKFNRITLKMDGSYNGWAISAIAANSIRIEKYQQYADLSYAGTLTPQGSQPNGPWTVWPNPMTSDLVQTGQADTLYLGAIAPKIVLNSGAMTTAKGNLPSSTSTYGFSSLTTLAAGRSYLLTVKFKTPLFASSNIFWDGTKLTFTGYSDTPWTEYPTEQLYSGLGFKFGSLVGISARSSSYPGWDISSTHLFVPRPGAGSYITTANGSINPHNTNWTGSAYSNIPYVSAGSASNGRWDRYVIDIGCSQANQMRGDICQYLDSLGHAPEPPEGKSWRLPISAEFGNTSNAWNGAWKKIMINDGIDYDRDSIDGRGRHVSGIGSYVAVYKYPADNVFPRNFAVRDETGTFDGYVNHYWTGSIRDANNGHFMTYDESSLSSFVSSGINRRRTSAVRCVLE